MESVYLKCYKLQKEVAASSVKDTRILSSERGPAFQDRYTESCSDGITFCTCPHKRINSYSLRWSQVKVFQKKIQTFIYLFSFNETLPCLVNFS